MIILFSQSLFLGLFFPLLVLVGGGSYNDPVVITAISSLVRGHAPLCSMFRALGKSASMVSPPCVLLVFSVCSVCRVLACSLRQLSSPGLYWIHGAHGPTRTPAPEASAILLLTDASFISLTAIEHDISPSLSLSFYIRFAPTSAHRTPDIRRSPSPPLVCQCSHPSAATSAHIFPCARCRSPTAVGAIPPIHSRAIGTCTASVD